MAYSATSRSLSLVRGDAETGSSPGVEQTPNERTALVSLILLCFRIQYLSRTQLRVPSASSVLCKNITRSHWKLC